MKDERGMFAVDDRVSANSVQLLTQALIVFSQRCELSFRDSVHRLLLLQRGLQYQHLQQLINAAEVK